MPKFYTTPVAKSVPFDATGTSMLSTDVEAGIKEAYAQVSGVSKGFVFSSYNGNAGTGRYLEFFNNIDSNTAPLYSSVALDIIEIVARATAISTCTLGFYNNTTLLYTITFTAATQVVVSATPLFTLAATGQLKIKVDSGSIQSPHLYFVTRGAT